MSLENYLIKQAQNGNAEALEMLWERAKAFALAVSRRFYPTAYADANDLQQCAYLGFHAAVMQHTGRYRFLSLVQWCTQRECQRLLDLYGSRRQVKADSLDILLPDGEHTPADLIEDDTLPEHDAQIIVSEIVRDVRAAVAELPERERTLIETRWLGIEPLTLGQTGDALGISGERARQLEQRAFDRLRADPVLRTYARSAEKCGDVVCRGGLTNFLATNSSVVEHEALRRIQRDTYEKKRQAQENAYASLLQSLTAEGFLDPGELQDLLPRVGG